MDTYANFEQLSRHEREGHDFVILVKTAPSRVAVMAPHGGGIEPGTVDVAHATAGDDHPFYAFQGIKPSGNGVLHITSNRFDEPRALRMARNADWVLTIHGCRDRVPCVYVGGRDARRRAAFLDALQAAGFRAEESLRPGLRGINPNNICNRGQTGRGVQLELSEPLRRQMFAPLQRPTARPRARTAVFHRLVEALRRTLKSQQARPAVPVGAPPPAVRWFIAETPRDRIKALMVRAIVFMEEQGVTFGDELDAHEEQALHILGEVAGEPLAAGRLRFDDGWARLERIAIRRAYRGRHLSHALIRFMLAEASRRGYRRYRLHAQLHLCDLYHRHGFRPRGRHFKEAGIDHVCMVREKTTGRGPT